MPTLECSGIELALAEECILGRHRASGLQIKDDAASRQHAKIFAAEGAWWLEDLKSANGTLLNGQRITGRKRLRDRDQIRIGQTIITFNDAGHGAAGDGTAAVAAAEGPAVPALDMTALVGSTISGYRIDRYLGRGMLGAVYQAQQLNLERPVAFKVFDPQRCVRDAQLRKRFLAEAGKVGSVSDDGLVQLHESGEADGLLWCSMEWIEGDTLEKLMQRDGTVDPDLALLIVDKVASALAVAHAQGVIHGDLRPSHIILMADGRIKLTDVGMMGIFEEGELPADGPAALAWYLSPEEATDGASDPRSDVYSLGCLLFHLLTGKPPFTGATTGAVIAAHAAQPIPSLPKQRLPAGLDVVKLDALLHGMLAKNPAWRYATMAEVRSELQPIREQLGGATAPPDVRPALHRSSERVASPRGPSEPQADARLRKVLTGALVGVGFLILVSLVLPMIGRSKPRDAEAETPPVPAREDHGSSVVQSAAPPVTRPAAAAAAPQGAEKPPQPAPEPAAPVPAETVPAVSLREPWAALQASVEQAQAANEWSTAEQALMAFVPEAKADPAIAQAVNQRLQQLASDGDAWYQAGLAKLANGDTPAALAERLRGIEALRNQALADNRPDAESRYQEALTKLVQRLNAAKRQARQAVEAGRMLDLPKIALELAPAFAQTPVTDLHRQFSLLCSEAAGTRPLWQTSWAVTKPRLLAAKGANALAAAAALLLVGDTAEAKALLANDPSLMSGDLLRRREALFGRKAAVLTFDDPDDLQYIEVFTGNPRMSGGTLTGPPGEVIAIACAAPLGSAGWDMAVGIRLEQATTDGQAVISLARGMASDAQVRIEKEALFSRVRTAGGWQETSFVRPPAKILRLRLTERGGTVTILVNDQVILQAAKAAVTPGSVLRFEASGMVWSITDLQSLSGE